MSVSLILFAAAVFIAGLALAALAVWALSRTTAGRDASDSLPPGPAERRGFDVVEGPDQSGEKH